MIKVTTSFKKHRLSASVYLEVKNQACMPDNSWWIMMLVIHEIAVIDAILYKSLQGHDKLL